MRKHRLIKPVVILLLIILLAVLCTNCVKRTYKSYLGLRPCDNPGTQWVSEDGDISFFTSESGDGIGVLYTGGQSIDIYIVFDIAVRLNVYHPENISDDAITGFPFETWEGDYTSDQSFVATVVESTYFDVGDEIEFYRVSN